MWVRTLLTAALVAGFLLPVVFRRQRRRAGIVRGQLTPTWRKRLLLVTGLSMVIVVAGVAGVASADGDPNGANTPPPATAAASVLPANTPPSDQAQILASRLAKHETAINLTWLMVGGVLVLFMQAGFALVETGFTRAKNGAHTMMMNLVIFALGAVGWFVCGYALMFGSTSVPIIGLNTAHTSWHIGHWGMLAHSGFFLGGGAYDVGVMAFFLSLIHISEPTRPY